MTDLTGKSQAIDSAVSRFWQRLPVVIRALVVGFLVAEIGIGAWLAVAALIPAPWSLVLMSAFLWAFWRYFSGNGWPKSTAEARRIRFRPTKMTVAIWKWGTLAAILFVVVVSFSWAARQILAARGQT